MSIENLFPHRIWIRVESKSPDKLLKKLYKENINVHDVKYLDDGLLLKISNDKLEYFQNNKRFHCHFQKNTGIYEIRANLWKKRYVALTILTIVILIYGWNQLIVQVEVIHSNKEIREYVTSTLEDKGIHKLSIKKDFKEIETIKKQILDENKDKLEWLEIERVGMKYVVRIEERIITIPKEEKNSCHLIATKSGIIKKIIHEKGEIVFDRDDYVSEGEIIISGILKANEEIKGTVCATGEVYAEVWYTTKLTIPLIEENYEKTGKNRTNFMLKTPLKNYDILKPRIENHIDEEQKLFGLFGYDFYKIKEQEIITTETKLSEEEALNKAQSLAKEKMLTQIGANGSIIDQKVLKKSLNDSTMEIEIFVSVSELISERQEFILEELKEGEENGNQHTD